MHHQYRLSVLQWNPGPARKNPMHILAAACGRFHAVILQEASDHAPRVSDQFVAYTGGTDLAILLNKDTFEPDSAVFAISKASFSKDTWGMAALVVRGLLRRPSLSGTPTVTICSVHVHNAVAKKRDASTSLLRRPHAHMVQHNVDFIGDDFNMSAFSTVGDVFTDPEFAAPGNCYKFDNAELGFGPRDQTAHFPVDLHLRTTNLAPTASHAVLRPSNGAWTELPESTSANGSRSNLRSKQHHDSPVPSIRENIWPHARASDMSSGTSQHAQRARARCVHGLH